ncbi:MAG: nucleotide exchange factor GrpE [Saprospiraceae bacterium]|mgnify:CR=1 FL=1|jgi:molecular chaperone GrpE|nr:nucleotide exchange factor GrpE [Saprospiraceae bacterium]MBP9209775.1 nucleotide exchange factor GrpE [Saprospiraceae bacterium]MBV6473331.1 Protein GrpE [Saprospiraceae bacterium]
MEDKRRPIEGETPIEEQGHSGLDDGAQTAELPAPDALDLMREELAEQKDKYIRLYAEFDNFKKRSLKEKIELIRNASQEVIQDLLVVLDDFERAEKLSQEHQRNDIYPEGMRLVHQKLVGILQAKGLESVESTGQRFDPSVHEAVTEIAAPTEAMRGKVVDTLEKAYLLNQKIIRFAKVVVAKQ